jgi:rhamnogalacturonyl hydrolase YesR
MLMHGSPNRSDINNPVDRKKADTVARRVARAERTKAITAWHEGKYRDFFHCVEQLAEFAYDYSYKSALKKAIARQIAPNVGHQIKLDTIRKK